MDSDEITSNGLPMPPNLGDTIRYAYNVLQDGFVGLPIFKITFDEGNTAFYGPDGAEKEYAIPDGVSFSQSPVSYQVQKSIVIKTASDYNDQLSAAVSGKFSGISYRGSGSSTLALQLDLSQELYSNRFVDIYNVQTYEAARHAVQPYLTPEFQDALRALPDPGKDGRIDTGPYFKLFDNYGTHYLSAAGYGGSYFMCTTVSESTTEKAGSMELSVNLQAGFDKALQSGEMEASAVIKSSSFLSQYLQESDINFLCIGALTRSIDEFERAVWKSPRMILNSFKNTNFQPISTLCETDAKTIAMEKAMELYILTNRGKDDGLIGSPVIVPKNWEFPVDRDGFLVMKASAGSGVVMSQVELHVLDGTSEVGMNESICYYPLQNANAPTNSLSIPVNQNGSYVCKAPDSINTDQRAMILSTVSGDPLFESFHEITNQIDAGAALAKADGFLLVTGTLAEGAGDQLRVDVGASEQEMELMGGCSLSFDASHLQMPNNSCLVPIQQGHYYKMTSEAKSGKNFRCYLKCAANQINILDEMRPVVRDVTYTATVDGFLVATAQAKDDGTEALLSCQVFAEGLSTIAQQTYIGNYSGFNTRMQLATVFIPVAKGLNYQVYCDSPVGSIDITAHFFPIGFRQA